MPIRRADSSFLNVHVASLLVQFAFASQIVESKLAMMPGSKGGLEMDPWAIVTIRMIGACIFFFGFAFFQRSYGRRGHGQKKEKSSFQHISLKLPVKTHATLIFLSLLGVVFNQVFFLMGLRRTSPQTASLFAIAIPIFSMTIALLLRKEKVAARKVLGLLIAGAGLVYLTGVSTPDFGAIFLAMNTFSYACYMVLSRDLVVKLSSFTVTAWTFFWASICFLPFGLPSLLHDIKHYNMYSALFIVYVIFVPTVFAYTLNAWAIAKTQASLVALYIPLQPLIAVALAYVQWRSPLPARFLTSSLFIVSGMFVAFLPNALFLKRSHKPAS